MISTTTEKINTINSFTDFMEGEIDLAISNLANGKDQLYCQMLNMFGNITNKNSIRYSKMIADDKVFKTWLSVDITFTIFGRCVIKIDNTSYLGDRVNTIVMAIAKYKRKEVKYIMHIFDKLNKKLVENNV